MKNEVVKEVELKGKDWENILDKVFKKKVNEVKIDGFRKGKCPKDVFIKKFGIEYLFMDAADLALRQVDSIIEKEDLKPVIPPSADIKDINKDHIVIELKVITKPEVKLGEYKNLGVTKDKAKVTSEELEKEEARIASRYTEKVIKENGEVLEGNEVKLDFTGYIDGKEFPGGSAEDYKLDIGSHSFIEGFEEGLVGMKVGETKELNLKFPKDYYKDYAGKDVVFKVTIKEISERILPEFNKDFFEDLGYEGITTKEEFDKEVKKAILERKEKEIDDKYINDLLTKACENMKVDINKEIIDYEVDSRIKRMRNDLQRQGISLEMYLQYTGKTMEEFTKEIVPDVERFVKERYLLEGIIEKEKIETSDKELDELMTKRAEEFGTTKEALLLEFGSEEVFRYDSNINKAIDKIKELNK